MGRTTHSTRAILHRDLPGTGCGLAPHGCPPLGDVRSPPRTSPSSRGRFRGEAVTEALQALLGAALYDQTQRAAALAARLDVDALPQGNLRDVAAAVQHLVRAHRPVDAVTVHGHLAEVGVQVAPTFLSSLMARHQGGNPQEYLLLHQTAARKAKLQDLLRRLHAATVAGDQAAVDLLHPQLEALVREGLHSGHHRLPFLDLTALLKETPAIPWIVEPFVALGDLTVVAAQAGVGKTWLGFDLALAVTQHRNFLHLPVRRAGPVLIFDRENGAPMIAARLKKLWGSDRPIPGLHLLHFPHAFVDDAAGRRLILQAVEEIQPALLVFDTLSKFHQAEENEAPAMTRVMSAFKEIAVQTRTGLVLFHHFGKDDGKKSAAQLTRGSSAIMDNADQAFALFRATNGLRVEQSKARQTEKMDEFIYKLIPLADTVMIGDRAEPRLALQVVDAAADTARGETERAVVEFCRKIEVAEKRPATRGEIEAFGESEHRWHRRKVGFALADAIYHGRLIKGDRTKLGQAYYTPEFQKD